MRDGIDLDRLSRILAMVDSGHEGEALAALRAARDQLARHGLGFRDLAEGLSPGRRARVAGLAAGNGAGASLGWALDTAHGEIERLHGVIAALEEQLAAIEEERDHWRALAAQSADPGSEGGGVDGPAESDRLDELLERFLRLERRLAGDRAGLRQSEIKAAVLAHLEDPQTAHLSNREIARRIGVSPQTVSNWRKRLGDLRPDRVVRRGGRTFRMRTDRIGRRDEA